MREGWRTVRLDEVADLQMGETLIAKDLTGEGLPVFSAAKDAEPWGFTSHARKRFRRGTIVIGARGTIGFPRLPDFDEFISTQTTIAVTPGPSADPAFLAHALARIDYSEVSAHQAVPMLTIGSFRDVEVSLPPLDEQRRIAAVLSAIDDVHDAAARVIRALASTRSSIMAGQISRGEWDGQLGVRSPNEYATVLLDQVAERRSGHTPSKSHPEYWDGGVKWISLRDSKRLDRLYISDTEATISTEGLANSSASLLPAGVVVLSRDASVGRAAITTSEMAVSQHFMAWRCGPRLDAHYLYYWLQAMKPVFENIASGNTVKTIGLPFFKQLRIALPPLDVQRRVAGLLKSIDQQRFGEEVVLGRLGRVKAAAAATLFAGAAA